VVFFWGFCEKGWCRTWFFAGVVVVDCMVNVVFKTIVFRALKIRQLFELYFAGAGFHVGT